MKITHHEQETDPAYPIMQGTTPTAKEFNKRMKELWTLGTIKKVDFELAHTLLMEILIEDYDRRHAPRKRVKKL